MLKILAESAYQREVANKLRLSFRLFMVGIVLGASLFSCALFLEVMVDYSSKIISVLFLFALCVFAMMNIGNYRRLLGKYTT